MLLFEAKQEIDSRLDETLQRDFRTQIPEYFDALEIASKCIDAQIRLADILNDWDAKQGDAFSERLVYDILSEIRFDWCNDDE